MGGGGVLADTPGCVPSTAVAVSWGGGSAQGGSAGGACPQGVFAQEGDVSARTGMHSCS